MDPKPLIALLRRTSKCKYTKLLMHNRMLMGCYTIDEDSDVGLHYILHIPDTPEYLDSFYDLTINLEPKALLTAYTGGHKKLLEVKRENKLKPKEVKEDVFVRVSKKSVQVKFMYYALDELVEVTEYSTPYPLSEIDPNVELVAETYYKMIDRVKAGGVGIAFDGQKYNLYNRALAAPEIYFFKVKLQGVKIRIPIYKSMFAGMKSWDEFFISIQETTLEGIYLVAIQFTAKGLTDQYIGYLQNF